MTVHGFSKAITPSVQRVEYKHFANERLAIDASIEIFRTATVSINKHMMNAKGEPTQHIKLTFDNALKMLNLGIDATWCFDGRKAPELKAETLEERREIKAKQDEKVKVIEDEYNELLNTEQSMTKEELLDLDPTFYTTLAAKELEFKDARRGNMGKDSFSKFKKDVYFILDCFGIRRMTAPDTVDAEHLAAWLCEQKMVDGVITPDPDALLYGASKIIKHRYKDSGKYDVYDREEILKRYDIDQDKLIKIGVALGTDFSAKVPGLGPVRVVKMVSSDAVDWTEAQKEAIAHFKTPFPVNEVPSVQKPFSKAGIGKLRDWLVDEQNFGAAALDKRLQVLYDRMDGIQPVKKVRKTAAKKKTAKSDTEDTNAEDIDVEKVEKGTKKLRIKSKKT